MFILFSPFLLEKNITDLNWKLLFQIIWVFLFLKAKSGTQGKWSVDLSHSLVLFYLFLICANAAEHSIWWSAPEILVQIAHHGSTNEGILRVGMTSINLLGKRCPLDVNKIGMLMSNQKGYEYGQIAFYFF